MKPPGESKADGPPAKPPGPKTPAEQLMRIIVHPAEPGSLENCRIQAFLGSDSLAAQRHLLRFRFGGPGL
jgi:hypothetical protein